MAEFFVPEMNRLCVADIRTSGLVVKSNVAIVGPRVRFSAGALIRHDVGGYHTCLSRRIPGFESLWRNFSFSSLAEQEPTTKPRSIQHQYAMVSSLNSLFLLFVLQFHPPINVTPFTASTQTVRMQAGSSLPIAQQLNSCLHLSSTTDSNDDEAIDISLDERLSRVRLSRATGIEWGTDLSFSFVYVRALEPAGKTWQGSMNQTVFCLLFLSRSNSSSQELLPYQIKLKLVTRYVNCVQLLLEMESQGCQQI